MGRTSVVDAHPLAEVKLGSHFALTERGLLISGTPSFAECEAMWATLRTCEKVIQFAIGDAAKYLRKRFGEKADQIISSATGWSFETIRAYEWVAEHVPEHVRRMDVLDYSHHQAVAKLPPKEQKKLLDKAAEGDEDGRRWTVRQLKAVVKAGGGDVATEYVLVVLCDSETKRDRLQAELEAKGYVCKASERHEEKED